MSSQNNHLAEVDYCCQIIVTTFCWNFLITVYLICLTKVTAMLKRDTYAVNSTSSSNADFIQVRRKQIYFVIESKPKLKPKEN